MPLTQSGSNSSANIETYNDYGNVTNVYSSSESNKLKKLKDILKPLLVTDQEANRPKCLKGTRVDLLQQIRTWARRVDPPNIFVLTGGAGTGKSTVARTIAEEFEAGKSLGCYIFFERGKTDSMTITSTIIKTIAYRLACHSPAIAESLLDVIKDDQELSFPSTNILFDRLLHKPLHFLSVSHISKPIFIVLDAFDECGSIYDQEELAYLLRDKVRELPSSIRFFVTSRPEEGITPLLSEFSPPSRICEHVKLNHMSENSKMEVTYYIRHELDKLRYERRIIVRGNWEWDENIDKLGSAAEGLFIWAATAIKFVNGVRAGRFDRLRKLVNDTRGVGMNLDMLYTTVLENCINWEDDEMKGTFSSVFSLILFGKKRLSDTEIDEILCYEEGTTSDVLSGLHSLVVFEPGQPIWIHHSSLYDYLTSTRCDESWYIDTDLEKSKIVSRCFGLMKCRLRFNICDLETSFKFNRDVPDIEKRVNERIHSGLLYACRHWASHLRDVPYSDELLSELNNFVYNQLLYWIEVLSLTKTLYASLESSLLNAIGWAKNKDGQMSSKISSFLEDALHHVYEFIQPISESTPHLYMTFLPLKRSESDVVEHYSRNIEGSACIEYLGDKQTTGYMRQISIGSSVSSMSLSFDENRVLSVSSSGEYSWNVDSGELIEGRFGGDVNELPPFFESNSAVEDLDDVDDKWVDSTYELVMDTDQRGVDTRRRGTYVDEWGAYTDEWDANTGERLYGLPTADIGQVTSAAINSKKYYATGFEDGAIQLWDCQKRTTIGAPLRGHSGKVLTLSFGGLSILPRRNARRLVRAWYLASGSEDGNIIVWDVKKQEKKYPPLRGHSGPVTSIAFTVRCRRLVSGSLDGTARLWNMYTGQMLHTFPANWMGSGVYSVARYDDQHILSGSEDGIVRMWDIKHSDVPPKKFVGPQGKVISLAVEDADRGRRFASGTSDGTIHVWGEETSRDTIVDYGSVITLAVSPDGEYVTSLSFSPDGFHFASGSTDETVRIWNLNGGSVTCWCIRQLVWAVCFSPDGKYLASGSGKTIRVWDSKSGRLVLNPLEGHLEKVSAVCYSPDGNRIVSGSDDQTICIWDALTGTLLLTFQGHSGRVVSVNYSLNGSCILSGSTDKSIRFWGADDGKPVREPIKVHEGKMGSACFSPDGTYFVSGSRDKTICVWFTSTGELLFKANVPSVVNSVVFLPTSDSKHIKFASASDDGLIRIWSVDVDSKEKIWNTPNSDGWVIGNDGNLLFWLPSNIHLTLVYGPCIRIFNSRLSTMLTLSKYQGSQWTSCLPSSNIV